MRQLTVLAATALLLSWTGIAGAAEPKEKSAKAKATSEARAKSAKKPAAKAPAGSVKQKTTQDNVGDTK